MYVRIVLLFALTASQPLLAGGMYRMTDENGNVVFTDRVPPAQVKNGYNVMDGQGREKQAVMPAKTAEERAREAQALKAKEDERLVADELARKDCMMLELYGNETAVLASRDANLKPIKARRAAHEENIAAMRKSIAAITEEAAQGLPKSDEFIVLTRRIAEEEAAIRKLDREHEAMTAHYAKVMATWREAKLRSESLPP